jgi:hypothetical protein
MANLMLSVMGAFAEFERALIRERQREGIALANQRGAYKGRKKTLTPERAAELVQRAAGGVPKSVLAPRLRHQPGNGVPIPTARHPSVEAIHDGRESQSPLRQAA